MNDQELAAELERFASRFPPVGHGHAMSAELQLSDALGALQQLVSASEAMLAHHEQTNVERAIERAKQVIREHEPMVTGTAASSPSAPAAQPGATAI